LKVRDKSLRQWSTSGTPPLLNIPLPPVAGKPHRRRPTRPGDKPELV